MSKGRKEGVDWKSGPDSLFRAARADHEASTADYARVEAELARRLAAGALPKLKIDGVESAAAGKLTPAFAPGTVAKLGIGVLLLAAGFFGAVRMFDVGPSAAPPAEIAPPLPAATVHAPESDPSRETAPAPAAMERRDTSRPERAERVATSHSGTRNLAAPKRQKASASQDSSAAKETSMTTPASVGSQASTPEPTGALAARVGSRGTAAYASTQAKTRRPSAPRKPAPQATQPRAAAPLDSDSDTDPQPETSPAVAATDTKSQTRPAPQALDARAELALIERMQAAMRAAEPAEALELCAEHEKRWPRGVFAEERQAVSAIASCALRTDDAAARAERFLRTHPRAPTAARVAAACAPLSAATRPAATH